MMFVMCVQWPIEPSIRPQSNLTQHLTYSVVFYPLIKSKTQKCIRSRTDKFNSFRLFSAIFIMHFPHKMRNTMLICSLYDAAWDVGGAEICRCTAWSCPHPSAPTCTALQPPAPRRCLAVSDTPTHSACVAALVPLELIIILIILFRTNSNSNGFRVLFRVRRRHQKPPFTLGIINL